MSANRPWPRLVRSAPAALALACGTAFTLLAWSAAENAVDSAARAQLNERVVDVDVAVRIGMAEYAQTLRAGVALFIASPDVERRQWRSYVDVIRRPQPRPGLVLVGYAPHIAHADLERHLARAQREGYEGYALRPSGERPDYFPLYYLEPLTPRELVMLGYDLYSDAAGRDAMDRARDTGAPAITAKLTLRQDEPRTAPAAIHMYLPIYRPPLEVRSVPQRRSAIAGYIYAGIHTGPLIAGFVGPPGGIRWQVFDGPGTSAAALLYDSHPGTDIAPDAAIASVVRVPAGGREWTLRATALPDFTAGIDRSRPGAILAAGAIITALLTLLVWSLASTRNRAVRLAERLTADLETSRERLALALEGSELALFDWHVREGRVMLSEAWSALLGGPAVATHTTAPALATLVHPDDLARVKERLDAVLAGKAAFYEIEHRVRAHDGRWVWIDSRAKVVERDAAGNALRLTGTNADITERKQVEEMKQRFVAIVSHELRTPLTSIIGGLTLMREEGARSPEDTRFLLDLAHDNANRLVALVNDILDAEKLREGQMTFAPKPFALGAFLREALHVNAPYAEQHKVAFVIDEPIPDASVLGDPARIMQVMTNLLSNAAKFSPEGAAIRVSASRRDRHARVEVTDLGPGVPEEFGSRIFTPFAQAAVGGKRPHKGTGLGLAISKAIMGRSGGSIGYTSEAGRGSTFYFEIPLAE